MVNLPNNKKSEAWIPSPDVEKKSFKWKRLLLGTIFVGLGEIYAPSIY
jgi:hypothetical protein